MSQRENVALPSLIVSDYRTKRHRLTSNTRISIPSPLLLYFPTFLKIMRQQCESRENTFLFFFFF